jgi:hypothetical protein
MGAWEQGWALGAGAAQQRSAHKQALSDMELQGKATQLAENLKNLQAKLPSLMDEKGQPTADYAQAQQAIQQNVRDLRELYHPDRNPGAIAKFGHILTDALKITNPQQRAQAASQRAAAGNAGDLWVAQGIEAAAPLSPQAVAAQQTQTEITSQQAKNNAALKWAEASGITGQALEDLKQHLAGVPVTRAKPLAGAKAYLGADGRYYEPMLNADGTISEEQMPPDYKPPTRPPSTSVSNEIADAYAKGYGITREDLTEADWDYMQRKSALDKAIPVSTTTTTIKPDVNGRPIPVTVTNYRTPGGNIQLVAPRGPMPKTGSAPGTTPGAQPVLGGPAAAPGNASTVPKTPAAAKKKAEANGIHGAPATTATKPANAGNVKVGAPLPFQMRTPQADAAQKNVDIAQNSLLDVQKASQDPTPVGDQGVILAWLRGRVNRVTATEIASVSNLGGAQMKLEGDIVRIVSGKMTDQQRAWFLESAQNNYDNAKTVASKYTNPGGDNTPQPAGSAPGEKSLADRLNDALQGK